MLTISSAAKRPRRTPPAIAAVDATAMETSVAAESLPPPNLAPGIEEESPHIQTDHVYPDHQLPPGDVVGCPVPAWLAADQYHEASVEASTSPCHDTASTGPALDQVWLWQNVAVPEAQPAGWVYWLPPVEAVSDAFDVDPQYPVATSESGTPFAPAAAGDYQWDATANAYPASYWAPDPSIVQDPPCACCVSRRD